MERSECLEPGIDMDVPVQKKAESPPNNVCISLTQPPRAPAISMLTEATEKKAPDQQITRSQANSWDNLGSTAQIVESSQHTLDNLHEQDEPSEEFDVGSEIGTEILLEPGHTGEHDKGDKISSSNDEEEVEIPTSQEEHGNKGGQEEDIGIVSSQDEDEVEVSSSQDQYVVTSNMESKFHRRIRLSVAPKPSAAMTHEASQRVGTKKRMHDSLRSSKTGLADERNAEPSFAQKSEQVLLTERAGKQKPIARKVSHTAHNQSCSSVERPVGVDTTSKPTKVLKSSPQKRKGTPVKTPDSRPCRTIGKQTKLNFSGQKSSEKRRSSHLLGCKQHFYGENSADDGYIVPTKTINRPKEANKNMRQTFCPESSSKKTRQRSRLMGCKQRSYAKAGTDDEAYVPNKTQKGLQKSSGKCSEYARGLASA